MHRAFLLFWLQLDTTRLEYIRFTDTELNGTSRDEVFVTSTGGTGDVVELGELTDLMLELVDIRAVDNTVPMQRPHGFFPPHPATKARLLANILARELHWDSSQEVVYIVDCVLRGAFTCVAQ